MPKKSFRSARYSQAWASFLKQRREELGLTREALAMAADISPALISKIERGVHDPRDMSVGRLQALLQALRVSPTELPFFADVPLPSASQAVLLPLYLSLAAACAGRSDPEERVCFDTRFLPPQTEKERFFIAPVDAQTLVAENISLEGSSWLLVERGASAKSRLLLGFLPKTGQPLLYAYGTNPRLLRPLKGTGPVYWLLPDGTLQPPSGKEGLHPTSVGTVHLELRRF
jgi:transcriptional regulator with XRE-family HTH domain